MAVLCYRVLTGGCPVLPGSHRWLSCVTGFSQVAVVCYRFLTGDCPVLPGSHRWLSCVTGFSPVTVLCYRVLTDDCPVLPGSHRWLSCVSGFSPVAVLVAGEVGEMRERVSQTDDGVVLSLSAQVTRQSQPVGLVDVYRATHGVRLIVLTLPGHSACMPKK